MDGLSYLFYSMKERPNNAKSPASIEKAALNEKIRTLDSKIHRLRSEINLMSHKQQQISNNEKSVMLSQLEQEKRRLIQQRKNKFGHKRRNGEFYWGYYLLEFVFYLGMGIIYLIMQSNFLK